MASKTIFPPLVGSSQPAFLAGGDLNIYFSLSSLSSGFDVNNGYAHVSIIRKDGVKVLKNTDDNDRYRSTGILLDVPISRASSLGDNQYFITIKQGDLRSKSGDYSGFIPGWIYKVQIRLSSVKYGGQGKQEEWLQIKSDFFSEWSTICYVKAISDMRLQIPLFNFDSKEPVEEDMIYRINDVDFFGSLSALEPSSNEDFDYVNLYLYEERNAEDILIDSSGNIFKSELSDSYFSYIFPISFKQDTKYTLKLTYITENGYEPLEPFSFSFYVDIDAMDHIDAMVYTIDSITVNNLDAVDTPSFSDINSQSTSTLDVFNNNLASIADETSLDAEEDEGRVALKLYSSLLDNYSGNICIQRSSSIDNFATWEDIKIINLKNQNINDVPVIYDYTIKSGVFYKYEILPISAKGKRGVRTNNMTKPIQRLFNFSYLLGEGEKQLKLNFDNRMGSFKIQVQDSKTETIGSKYPFITRNAEVYYRTFPIEGLISFWMDENDLFLQSIEFGGSQHTFLKNGKKDIYGGNAQVNLYEEYNEKRGILQYDYTYERDFREKVLEFLLDGKPKLFKSPTEGNIIVRLTDINCTPNGSLDRMIYSFSCTASEIDDAIMKNYLKYGFYNPGSYITDFSVVTTYLGQLKGTFKPSDNILKLIREKYDSGERNIGGYTRRLQTINRLKITIDDPPSRVTNNDGKLCLGHNFVYSYVDDEESKQTITIYYPRGIYEFDSLIEFDGQGTGFLRLEGDPNNTEINATIDFLYTLSEKPYENKEVAYEKSVRGIGQYYQETVPGTSIYKNIALKYRIETNSIFSKLSRIKDIEIEANPHTVFEIKDNSMSEIGHERHEVGDTGILKLYVEDTDILDIRYVGKRYIPNMYDDSLVSETTITEDTKVKDAYGNEVEVKAAADVSVTYSYVLRQGAYKPKQ